MDRYVHGAVLDMHMAREELIKALDEVGERDWERYVPYGSRTLHELLAHVAAADQAWAVAAQGLLRGEGVDAPPLAPAEAKAARTRGIERGRGRTIDDLREEMDRRRKLLLGLFELLEPRHLALALRSYGDQHNSVRERIWLGYHDRLHAADVRRALRLTWHPSELKFAAEIAPAAAALSPDATLYVAYNVDPVQWERPSPVPDWTYRNLLAHIATGDWVLQTHLRHLLEHSTPAEWPDVAAGNARLTEERRHSPDHALIEEYLSMRHETLLLISRLKPKHLTQPIEFWWEPEPNSRSIRQYLEGFERHDRQHRDQLRPAMKYARDGGG